MRVHERASKVRVCAALVCAQVLVACGEAGSSELLGSAEGAPVHENTQVGKSVQAIADASSPAGKWYLSANGFRLELDMTAVSGGFTGTIKDEGGSSNSLSNVTWDPAGRWLEFRRNGAGFSQWYRLSLVQGVLSGRFSHATTSTKPAFTAYTSHVTGWSPTYVDSTAVPRVWRVTLNSKYQAVLRIDRDSAGTLRGRLKVFDDSTVTGAQEELETDLTGISWNGTNLSFTRSGPGFTQVYSGTASGRFISGAFTHNAGPAIAWSGARAEVLGFGLGSRLSTRTAWQEQTRERIVNLTEGMRLANASIPAVTVTEQPCTGCPFTSGGFYAERDDNPNAWPPSYTLKRLKFVVQPGNRFDPARPPPPREFFGYLSIPTVPPPAGGYRVVVAVNGHGGSAQQLVSQNTIFWHGESAARRHLAVLAIDIGHRPVWNDPTVVHPAIVGSGYASSDWEEEGERAFSVRRAIDYLSTVPNLNLNRIFIAGLSMGGEVSTITAGLDPRIAFTMASGYSPDMYVMDNYGNHPCYRWTRADIHEYLDVSDYQALIAPRALLVQTGILDGIFSPLSTPFAADKQVTRRARAAYGSDSAKLIHYLHHGGHLFHVGDIDPANPSHPRGVRAASVTAPTSSTDQSWQTSSATVERSPTLYHLMNELVP